MVNLQIKFPLIVVSAKETEQEGQAVFDDFVPNRKMRKTSFGKMPAWVKELPKTKSVWSPITIDKVLFIFPSEDLAVHISTLEKLPLVYGTLDFIALQNPSEVMGWIEKSGAQKVRLYTIAAPPDDPLKPRIASSEISVSDLKFEEEV